MELIIVGIDPGTTIGYCVLSLNNEVVKLESTKELDLNRLIKEIIHIGKPIAVGCDKSQAPSFVRNFSAKTGSRLFSPKKDLLITEKKELIKGYNVKIKNDHEFDALASAHFAFNQVKNTIKDVFSYSEKRKKEHIKNELLEMMLKNPSLNLKHILEIIESRDKNEEKRTVRDILQTEESFDRFKRLYSKIVEKEERLRKMQSEFDKQEREKNELEKKIEKIGGKLKTFSIDEETRKILNFKEQKILIQEAIINELKRQIEQKEKKIDKLTKALIDDNIITIKKLENLGTKEFELKAKKLNFKKEEVIFCKNPQIISDKSVELLKNCPLLFVDTDLTQNLKNKIKIPIINIKNAIISETDEFIFLDKNKLEEIKKKEKFLYSIIEKYKKERRG